MNVATLAEIGVAIIEWRRQYSIEPEMEQALKTFGLDLTHRLEGPLYRALIWLMMEKGIPMRVEEILTNTHQKRYLLADEYGDLVVPVIRYLKYLDSLGHARYILRSSLLSA